MNTGIYGILELEQKVNITQLLVDLSMIKNECLNRVHTPTWNDLMNVLMKNQIKKN